MHATEKKKKMFNPAIGGDDDYFEHTHKKTRIFINK